MPIETLSYAPLWRRLLAAVYDLLPVGGLLMIATGAAVLVARLLVPVDRVDLVLRSGWPHLLLQLWLGALTLAYYVVSWRRGGQTIGMRTWRIAVRGESGPITLGTALKRALFGLFLPGLLWCLVDPRRRALHDVLTATEVVQQAKR